MSLREQISFGFEQTFTITNWWEDEGFCNKSDTPLKRGKMLLLAENLATRLDAKVIESVDIWDNLQYEVQCDGETQFFITMDPGSIEVKTQPKYIDEIEAYCAPLFDAANDSTLLPYRPWWYGVNKGTEGGCHVNMGGMTLNSNPFIADPDLLVKYAAFVHNRPYLTYPFMGVDVGPGGNAQRMDEKEDFDKLKSLFDKYQEKKFTNLDEVYDYFKSTNIITDKSSYPSFKKLPLKLIEDRAQEALRSAKELILVCELRVAILEYVKERPLEKLLTFEDLHGVELTSFKLWDNFLGFCAELKLNCVDYQIFFDRQFPKLFMGDNPAQKFIVKEGRRPRKILEVYKNKQGEVTGKKVDTNDKRFEFYYNTETEEQFEFVLEYDGLEFLNETLRHSSYLNFGDIGTSYFSYADIKVIEENSLMKVYLKDKLTDEIVDSCQLNLSSMMFE